MSVAARYQYLEALRKLAQTQQLLVQEEARSVAIALFTRANLIVHLGLDQPNGVKEDWYTQCDHPLLKATATVLDTLMNWPHIEQLEFLISEGGEPLIGLQGRLSRQVFHRDSPLTPDSLRPSNLCQTLETQRIYVFSNHSGD